MNDLYNTPGESYLTKVEELRQNTWESRKEISGFTVWQGKVAQSQTRSVKSGLEHMKGRWI